MDIVLIRHAHDVTAEDGDRVLSDRGCSQAHALACELARAQFDTLWCSTSTRSRQTATELEVALGLTALIDARIDEIRNRLPDASEVPPPRERTAPARRTGVEEWPDFLHRVACFVGEICLGDEGRHAVVTHSGVFDAVHELLTGSERRVEMDVGHTGITTWTHRKGSPAGTWILRRHNDQTHLSLISSGRVHAP